MSLLVEQFFVGGFDDNFSYVVHDTVTKDAFVVDPSGDVTKILEFIELKKLSVAGILVTHTHFDHIDKLSEVIKKYGDIPIYVHMLGVNVVGEYASIQGIDDHETITLGNGMLKVLHTPGHIDDAVCFFIDRENTADGIPKVITGDTLFVGGCGRTSSHQVKDLYESLAELRQLPYETIVYCGHNYGETSTSTIGHEVQTNKYYLVNSFNEFKKLRLG